MSDSLPFERISLIGLGLMNASLAGAIQNAGLAVEVVGYARRQETCDAALAAGYVSSASTDLSQAVAGADLIILGTPVLAMEQVVRDMADALQPGALITDQGSTKTWLVEALTPLASEAGAQFIGSHPMCGSAKQGLESAKPEIFNGSPLILTPTSSSSPDLVDRLTRFWKALGMRVLVMEAALHDELVAEISHVPHLLATALALSAAQHPEAGKQLNEVVGTGFEGMTRMAAGSPDMWHDIVHTNPEPIVASLARIRGVIQEFEELLRTGDYDRAKTLLAQGVGDREAVIQRRSSTS